MYTKIRPIIASILATIILLAPALNSSSHAEQKITVNTQASSWTQVASPTTMQLLDVDIVSSNDTWAAGGEYGSSGVGIILHWNGGNWQTVPIPATQVLRSIAMISADDGWAVGGYDVGVSNILHWNGISWTSVASPSSFWFDGVSAVSTNDVWAVGGAGKIAHWNGNSWNLFTSPTTNNLNSIQMLTAADGWAVGNNGTILHWDGNAWQVVSSPTSTYLISVYMRLGNDGWAVGGLPGSTILRWNGNSWINTSSPIADMLNDQIATSSTSAWAVGNSGAILHWNGNAWNSVTSPTNQALNAIDVELNGEGWIVGTNGTILHRAASFPELDLPISYASFAQAAQGNFGEGTGKVNSWFDHTSPTYAINQDTTVWTGMRYTGAYTTSVATCIRVACYDGHNGIDFQHDWSIPNEPVYASASGTVVEACLVNPCSRGAPYGKYLVINHGGGYGSLSGHLASITNGVITGTVVTQDQQIGIMGGTGGWPVHLHFTLYYDKNGDGIWQENDAVDPYGWHGNYPDPWNVPSVYAWKYPLNDQQIGSPTTALTLTAPSQTGQMIIPAGALTTTLTLDFWDAPPVSAPSAQLRSTGNSFWLRVLEWEQGGTGGSSLSASSVSAQSTPMFSASVTITVTYTDTDVLHLEESQLQIMHWDEESSSWVGLPTTLDTVNNVASAQTLETGSFDLQGPLLCMTDIAEPNGNYDASGTVTPNDGSVASLFDASTDVDWFRFMAQAMGVYTLTTSSLASGVDTVLEVYDQNGVTLLRSDDNGGGGLSSRIVWSAPSAGTYFVRVLPGNGSTTGCGATYTVGIQEQAPKIVYLPLVRR